ncbi:gag-pol polyprotein [Lasius niger]|uniref:Gag-pol polyprotein n=1 Tax=Lasius niger TaxID=67767 RepID=A0A0J7K4F5_LASNI|nr:gag-pol polyprotein [Lasius niger]
MSGCQYFVFFVDESTGFIKVAFIKTKNEVLNAFKKIVQEVKTETGNRVEVLRTDQGTEFTGKEFKIFLQENNINHEMSVEYTPQSNGLAERSIRTLTEKARAMILDAKVPKSLWAECVYTSAYLSNRLPRADGSVTSFELWHKKPVTIEHLKSFACQAYVHMPRQKRAKFEAKAWKGILIGYGQSDKMYRIYDPHWRRVEVVRDVKFNEVNEKKDRVIFTEDEVNIYDEDIEENKSTIHDEELSKSEQEAPVIKKPGRPKGSKNKTYSTVPLSISLQSRNVPKITEESDQEANDDQEDDYIALMAMDEQPTFEDALKSDQGDQWLSAMQDELDSLVKNKVFEVTKLLKDKKPLLTGWVLKTKRNPDGTIDRLKARIVAKGYAQKSGLDYNETYAPVVRSESVRVLLGIVAYEDLCMVQCDVMMAFLYGDLEEDIYVRPPEGIVLENTQVWRLKKSLYGLKQSPRCWNTKFDYFLTKFGLKRTEADPCIYYSHGDKRGRILIALYVDDLLIAGSSNEMVNEVVEHLKKEFEIKVFEPNCFVGFELERDRANKTISLSQIGYLRRVLERFNMTNCNQSSTPGEEKSSRKTDETMKTIREVTFPYRQAIGSLLYAAMMTRPNFAFQVGIQQHDWSANLQNQTMWW